MSDPQSRAGTEPWYVRDTSNRTQLRGYIAGQMGKGAFYAACVFFGVLFFIGFLRLVATFLPDDPYAAVEITERMLHLAA